MVVGWSGVKCDDDGEVVYSVVWCEVGWGWWYDQVVCVEATGFRQVCEVTV